MMSHKKNYFILISLSFLISVVGYSAEPKKHFYLLGGGGEPKGNETVFDNDLKLIGTFVRLSQDWQTTVSFNGGHYQTEEILKKRFAQAKNAGPFIEKNYNALLDEMIQKIESGTLAKGDQLLVNIVSHGGPSTGKTHEISLAGREAKDLSTLEGSDVISLDRLEKLIDIASRKEVKLAIMDMSCFSGNTLKLKNDKVCLISGSSPDHYSYGNTKDYGGFQTTGTFIGDFLNSLRKGKNLEDIFLSARSKSIVGADFPMISTPEGDAIDSLLYKLITPYLRFNQSDVNDLEESYSFDRPYKNSIALENFAQFESNICSLEQNHNSFQDLLTQYQKLNLVFNNFYTNTNEFKDLQRALDDYRDYQRKYEVTLRGDYEVVLELKTILERDYLADKEIWEPYDTETFFQIEWAEFKMRQYENDQYSSSPDARETARKVISDGKRRIQITNEVHTKLSAESKKKIAERKKLFAKAPLSYLYAMRVAKNAKNVYDILYKSMQKKNKDKSNPCRDFVL